MCGVGDLYLIDFPYVEEYTFKERPALLVTKLYDDSFVCCMVTKVKNPFDFSIPLDNDDLVEGKTNYNPSYIRPLRLATVNPKRFGRKLAKVNDTIMEQVREALKQGLGLS